MRVILKFILYVVLSSCSLLLLVTIFISSIQINTLNNTLSPKFKYIIISIFPESFAFFTKDPKDAQIILYSVQKNNVEKINLKTNSSYNFWGLSRKARRLTYEIGVLTKKIPDSLWSEIKESNIKNIDFDNISHYLLEKDNNIQLLEKGKYVLYYYKPIPWEWNDLKKETNGKYVCVSIE